MKESNILKISVDLNDLTDLKKIISKLQKRRKQLLRETCNYEPMHLGSSTINIEDRLPSLDFIVKNRFIDEGASDRFYYVYAHCDSTKPLNVHRDMREYILASHYKMTHIPFYIGKGTGQRCYELNRNEGHRKIRTRLKHLGKEVLVDKILINLSEGEALFEEQKLIFLLGLVSLNKNGFLINLSTDKKFASNIRKKFLAEFKGTDIQKKKGKNLINKLSKWSS